MSENDGLFLEYAKYPPNKGILENATVRHFEENRTCGDALEVFLVIEDGTVRDFSFEGKTSIVTTACAAMFGEAILGEDIGRILSMTSLDMIEIAGPVSPRRRAASVLGLLATRNAIHAYLKDGATDDFSDVIVG